MKLLRKTWFKVIISLLIGGMTSELVHISTGDPNREMESNPSIVISIVLYFAITIGVLFYDNHKKKSDEL